MIPTDSQEGFATARCAHLVRLERFGDCGHNVITDTASRAFSVIRSFLAHRFWDGWMPSKRIAMSMRYFRRLRAVLLAALLLMMGIHASSAQVETPILQIQIGAEKRQFSVAELLANPAARPIEIARDASYPRPMRYQAVPLLDLLHGLPTAGISTLEARAKDGFVSEIPWRLLAHRKPGYSLPWIAIENPQHPWPRLDGKPYSAGPFYLVWENPELSGVTSEQWPYALVSLTSVFDPLHRWPQLSIGANVPKNHPAWRGQAVYIAQCLPCHRLRGAGEGTVGPDLGQPMPAVAYFTEAGLKKLIRDPAAVRSWPQQQMPPTDLSDSDIDAVIAYLRLTSGTVPH
jgi:mono/diheme cytochrome c family protein